MRNDVVELRLPEGRLFGTAATLSPVLLTDTARRSFAYHKLAQPLLKLCVLKLDGSFFEVQVPKTATVAELKDAVEGVFSQWRKDKEIYISWSHVWGHFCLSYKGQKLINDKAFIRLFGIKNGDQLKFVQHLSVNCDRERRRGTTQRSVSPYDHVRVVPWNECT